MADVFISYSRKDKSFVQKLYDALKALHREAWVDWEGIPPTAEWIKEIYAGIEAVNAFLCVLSPDFIASSVCLEEVEHAVACKKRIIPIVCREVKADKVKQVNSDLASLNWIFFREYDDFDTALKSLTDALDTDLDYVRTNTRLLVRALEWERKGYNSSFVLRGNDLVEAEHWLIEAADKKPSSTALQTRYITASRRATTKRQRIAFGAVSFGLVITLILSIISFTLYQAEQRATQLALNRLRTAQSQALAARSNSYRLQNQIDPALLLSVKAYQTEDTYESRDSLLSALEYNPHIATVLRDSVPTSTASTFGQSVTSLAFSPDGRTLISSDISSYVNSGSYFPSGMSDGVSSDEGSPGSKLIGSLLPASHRLYGGITLWNMETKRPHNLLLASIKHPSGVTDVTFSPNGQMFASMGYEGVWVWDNKTDTPLAYYIYLPDLTRTERLAKIAFSPDGKFLVAGGCGKFDNTGCIQGQLLLWSLTTRKLISSSISNQIGFINRIAFSPDGKLLVAAGCDSSCTEGRILFWDMSTGKPTGPIGSPIILSHNEVNDIQFNPDGKILAAGGNDGTITLWNVVSRHRIGSPLFGHTEQVNSIAFNPGGSILASGSADKTVRLWDMTKGTPIGKPLVGHQDGVTSVVWSSNGQLASGDRSDGLILWDISPGSSIPASRVLEDPNSIYSTAPSPNGNLLASGYAKGKIVLRDATKLIDVGTLSVPTSFANAQGSSQDYDDSLIVGSLTFSSDGRMLASEIGSGTIILWNVTRRDIITVLGPGSYGTDQSIALSPDGHILAGCSYHGIILWNVATQTVIKQLSREVCENLAFSSDGQMLASFGGGEVMLWNVATGHSIDQLIANQGFANPFTGMAFSPNGHTIAIIRQDGVVTLRDVVTRTIRAQFQDEGYHTYPNAAFSPDGKMLAISSNDTVSVWNVKTLERIAHPFHYPDLLSNLMFSSGGQLLVSADSHHLIVSDINSQMWQTRGCGIVNRNLTADEWKQFGGGDPYQKVCPDLAVDESEIKEMLMQAQSAARGDDKNTASADYTQVTQWAVEANDPIIDRYICWYGSVDQFAKEVLPACQRAVELEPDNGLYRDSRGLARALRGDKQGAIEDFQFFVTWATENINNTGYESYYSIKDVWTPYINEQKAWIKALEAGSNPFTTKTLDKLRQE